MCRPERPKARLIVLSRRASDFFQRLSSDESISDFQSLDRIHNICVLSFFIGVVSSETVVSVLSGRRPWAFFRILLSFCQEVPVVRRFQAGCVPAVCTIQGKARGHLPRLTPSAQGAVFRPAFYFCLRLQAVSSQKRFAALKKSSPLQGCPVRASGKGEFFQPRGAFFQISFSFSSSGTSCVRSGITRHAPACRSCSPGVLVCTAAQRMPARAAA